MLPPATSPASPPPCPCCGRAALAYERSIAAVDAVRAELDALTEDLRQRNARLAALATGASRTEQGASK